MVQNFFGIFSLSDRPLWHFDFSLTSTFNPKDPLRITVYFYPWPSSLAEKTVHYIPGMSTLTQMTVRFGSRPSTFRRTVHFRSIVQFKDRLLSPFWTVHFGPDSLLRLSFFEISQIFVLILCYLFLFYCNSAEKRIS